MVLKVITLVLAVLAVSDCYNFLVIFPYASRSHIILANSLVGALLERGHQVTYVNPYRSRKPTEGLTELDFGFSLKDWDEMMTTVMRLNLQHKEMDLSMVKSFAGNVTYQYARHGLLQAVLKDRNQHFDAVISDWFLVDFLAALPSAIGSPSIMMASFGMFPHIEHMVDEVVNPAVEPNVLIGYNSPMSFFERLHNTYVTIAMIAGTRLIDQPAEELAYKDILGPVAAARGIQLPDFYAAIHNTSLVLSNSHHSMSSASKLPPNVVEIGGFHVDVKPEPLTPELQKIMDDAKDGVIYFSLGSNLKSINLPLTIKNGLLGIFRGLKQTVIWKFEGDFPNLPVNVHVVKWAPQQSVLAHPNTKIFVTHGGLLSTTEAIHHGVPLIGIPFFGDQLVNIARAVKKGYALQVVITDVDFVKILKSHITGILHDHKYAAKVKELSVLYHDRPIPPKELAVYWIEHVARTRGALHLRSKAMQVSWYQRYMLDFVALLLGALLLIKWTLNWGYRKLAGKRKAE